MALNSDDFGKLLREMDEKGSINKATLWYRPADQPPTPDQIERAARLLGTRVKVIEHDEHPGEPPSAWVAPDDMGFVLLVTEKPLPAGHEAAKDDIYVVVEDPDSGDDNAMRFGER